MSEIHIRMVAGAVRVKSCVEAGCVGFFVIRHILLLFCRKAEIRRRCWGVGNGMGAGRGEGSGDGRGGMIHVDSVAIDRHLSHG
jgi:hypothetical protein